MILHVWSIPENVPAHNTVFYSFIQQIREVFFHDSTIYFIFISGFLFHYLSPRFEILRYYKSKFQIVALPYLFMTTVVLILYYDEYGISVSYSGLRKIIYIFVYGGAQLQYWYIPFICIVFAVSPLLLKIPSRKLTQLSPIFFILPLLGTRTGTQLSLGQYLYFFPIYILGMVCSANYEKIEPFLMKHVKMFLTLSMIFLPVVYFADKIDFNIKFIDLYESVHYIHKMMMISVLLVFFKKIEHLNFKILDLLAVYSFSLYFTHYLVFLFTSESFYKLIGNVGPFLVPISIMYSLLVVLMALSLCVLVKKLFRTKAKFLIGA